MEPPSKQQFPLMQLLGWGGFGSVYLTKRNTGIDRNRAYVMKVIEKTAMSTERYIMNEIKILQDIGNEPFMVHLHYVFDNPSTAFLVFDYVGGGDLATLLKRRNQGNGLERNLVRFVIAEVVLALEFLHQRNIVHRDVKPGNVLIDFDGHAVLSDMGLARYLPEDSSMQMTICGTVGFTAPEVLATGIYDTKADWYSLGVLTYVLILGLTSMPSSFEDTKCLLEKEELDLHLPRNLWHKARDFLKSLIIKDPRERLACSNQSTRKIKSHPFFCSIDWVALKEKKLRVPYIPCHRNKYDTQHFWRQKNMVRGVQNKCDYHSKMPAVCTYIAKWYPNPKNQLPDCEKKND